MNHYHSEVRYEVLKNFSIINPRTKAMYSLFAGDIWRLESEDGDEKRLEYQRIDGGFDHITIEQKYLVAKFKLYEG